MIFPLCFQRIRKTPTEAGASYSDGRRCGLPPRPGCLAFRPTPASAVTVQRAARRCPIQVAAHLHPGTATRAQHERAGRCPCPRRGRLYRQRRKDHQRRRPSYTRRTARQECRKTHVDAARASRRHQRQESAASGYGHLTRSRPQDSDSNTAAPQWGPHRAVGGRDMGDGTGRR